MSGNEWLISGLAVLVASALQATTGVGLGLMAGPALLLIMGSTDAVHVAILLNLVVSVLLLPGETREVDRGRLRSLVIGTVVGLPGGVLLVNSVNLLTLKLLAAVAIVAGAAQLIRARFREGPAAPHAGPGIVKTGAIVSGAMSGGLAMPGPVAMWVLMRCGRSAAAVRATLRALFVVSYGAAFLMHAAVGLRWATVLDATLALTPAVLLGVALGYLLKRRLREPVLSAALLVVLVTMGLSLLGNSLMAIYAGA